MVWQLVESSLNSWHAHFVAQSTVVVSLIYAYGNWKKKLYTQNIMCYETFFFLSTHSICTHYSNLINYEYELHLDVKVLLLLPHIFFFLLVFLLRHPLKVIMSTFTAFYVTLKLNLALKIEWNDNCVNERFWRLFVFFFEKEVKKN